MPVLMILVAVAILVGVFFVATGRGGELAYEQADHAPLDLGPVSATDVAMLRPPTALWGYNMQVTDEALEQIAQAIRDRDVTIAFLQQRLADLSSPTAPVFQPEPPRRAASVLPPEPRRAASVLPPELPRRAPYAESAEAGAPASAEPPPALPGQHDPAEAKPGDNALTAEEQSR